MLENIKSGGDLPLRVIEYEEQTRYGETLMVFAESPSQGWY